MVRMITLWLMAIPAWALAADPLDSAARVIRDLAGGQRAIGSGVVIAETPPHAWYVLTNAHVAGTEIGETVTVEFFADGYQTRGVGEVVWAAYSARVGLDAAVVRVPWAKLEHAPRPIRTHIAPVQRGQTIMSAGCPQGNWPNMFQGHVMETRDGLIRFYPQPVQGRSGSAICDEEGRIIGLLTWADPEAKQGLAQSWEAILAAMRGQPAPSGPIVDRTAGAMLCSMVTLPWIESAPSAAEPPAGLQTLPYIVQTDPLQCPPGGCPTPSQPWGAAPFRRPPQPGPQAPDTRPTTPKPWADMPPIETAPPEAPPPPSPPPEAQPAPQPGPQPPPADQERFGWWRPFRRGESPERPSPPPDAQPQGILMDRGLAQLLDYLADQVRHAFTTGDGRTVTPAQAIEELQRLGERVDRLEAQWRRTNDLIERTDGKVWPAIVAIAAIVAIRMILPLVLTQLYGAEEAARILAVLRTLRPRAEKQS